MIYVVCYFCGFMVLLIALTAYDEANGIGVRDARKNFWGALVWPLILVIATGLLIGRAQRKSGR